MLEQKLAGILYCPMDNLGYFSSQTSEQITQANADDLASYGSHNSVTIKSIESNPVYLGVPIIKFDWTVKLDRLKRILSLTRRAVAVNTHVYSTLYFFNQHDCIPGRLFF
ncbi:unnamed protein product [Ambrosiozyma monospora]|uniref:Unnamed protein product n=1 Tax=Ambrosiozyma monospora TaxID=43982 RepID=A0ACB5SVS2_AMBMO|nr:unnamed protein product [Ambrosiozyma monospora]